MKFSLSWLKAHLDTDACATEIAEKLTSIGLEIEGMENPADALRPFRVAKVLEAGPHPNADKLQLLKVADGAAEPWQVVCGAPNARAGMIGVFGPPGTYIPGSDFTLKPAKIRDVESFGMMCSYRELELGDDHDGIIELPKSAASEVGTSYADYAKLDDPVFDVSITPNRQDCMGVRGIARDLAAAGLGTLKPLDIATIARNGAGPDVRTEDPEGCPAFYGCTVKGVSNGASPDWMQARLKSAGQKPINTLVDITNYVMLEHGRPLHVYDVGKLNGGLVARKAKPGETVLALNDNEYTLDESMTVIADDNGAHDIGGIMGGANTGSDQATTEVLIECAYFTPENIAKTGQKLMLTSDARQRFERGVDPAFLDDGLELATALVLELCGGTASAVTRAGSPPTEQRRIAYNPAQCLALGGLDVAPDRQKAILKALGFTIADDWTITIPTWRRDVQGWQDIVEEIVRIEGLDSIPSTPLPRKPGVAKPTASPEQLAERKARRAAAARGLNELVNWSFISEKEAAPFGGGTWALANPISEDLKVMRPSLLPGLIAAAKRNSARGAASIRLFEVGRRYLESSEHPTIGLVLTGEKSARSWQGGAASRFDAYDAKAEVLAILEAAGVPVDKLMDFGFDDSGHSNAYHPGQSGTLRLGPKKILAAYGALHPSVTKALGLKGAAVGAEIFLDAIPLKKKAGHMRDAFAPPALQAVTRDFAFIVDADLPAGDLVRAVKGADKKLITDARIFDLFEGPSVGEGKKSLAVEVTLQPMDATLTEDDLKALSDKVVASAGKLGAELRG
ncbi:MAG: phenylalanine--tRNA ligase subunit beta [Sphingomonadales bacterium]|nr:phenylalanine--tRNA ligase subunit beta [Sphingomonadales bacterium]PIX66429.1 MAG: phenylalanine--tRNA ligase subunit beta [Sphingomonadales bacterium CG_4_10_14_3_um_filter_58_15]NCO50001.1 phenylalanine--tRNA ligase subunit beta [Sphingomonadales bacterium]NCP00464.1 phenylalanine--tRNA ligase subunit beta [Sphingomonadales bacterium]NCP26702.1 phenylalanine--tRNA ligase subunit beta [Sphingomonadales bacterium]